MAKCAVIGESKTFKPITLQITLETQGEFDALYCVFNASSSEIFELASDCARAGISTESDWDSVAQEGYNKLRKAIYG